MCEIAAEKRNQKRGGAMTKIYCNHCHTNQKADVIEIKIPEMYYNPELMAFYLLIIPACANCGSRKILPVGLTYLGNFVEYEYLKLRFCEKLARNIIRKLDGLPIIQHAKDKKGFYLLYSERGVVKRCYSNLSTLKLGIDPNWDRNYAS